MESLQPSDQNRSWIHNRQRLKPLTRLNECLIHATRDECIDLLLLGARWISLIPPVLALVLHTASIKPSASPEALPSPETVSRFVFAVALLANVLVHIFYGRLRRLVARRPAVLGIDMALAAAFISLTGGVSSPYYLYALNPLLAAAFLFHIAG
jgi:hypothetical protein